MQSSCVPKKLFVVKCGWGHIAGITSREADVLQQPHPPQLRTHCREWSGNKPNLRERADDRIKHPSRPAGGTEKTQPRELRAPFQLS
ncbi:hypothetical protein CapIbe_021524 [Capra ibex]